MADGNPLQNVARNIAKGTRNAASNGDILDTARSAVQGAVTAGQKVSSNVAKSASNIVDAMQQNQK
ncbi:hypothetical protein NZD89_08550 [Alicyclobacillus fastidiosus]|uniref:Uncharacterized protein n=1 Tax=Alicyclobacillus fastidiosus TaxID=392011 RepID=A0ABY6ZKU6_9BACL|nr:hypothetical protein [Alicyclobacillus fastidiosus]WAH43420.1 hypothetical protein NZD89_08550 [Alicyclobacillus fastidiosus]GMA59567.1 hypothetical protein GCM10025859_00070 [Alicyclobacillus fastidiosus]GMA65494.1 hypothetical protein GCM10025859_59340 [Alicyclobacillus fastidiosus]